MACRRRWVAGMAVAVLGIGACGDDGDAAPTTTTERSTTTTAETTTTSEAPPRPTSTTTTMFDPASVEGEVEAAYLRSWDVYADAVYNLELDEQALAEVYAEPHLSEVADEIRDRIGDGRAAHVLIRHNYEVTLESDVRAFVVDHYVNHQRLIDPETKEYVEDDPNETLTDVVTLDLVGGSWRVSQWQAVE